MTFDEFNNWFDRHQNRFPGVSKTLANDPTIAADYFERLAQFDVSSANKATVEIMAMDPQPFPGDHLGKIITICSSLRFSKSTAPKKQWSNQVDSFKCLTCRDLGTVEVYHPMAYQPIRDQTFQTDKHLRSIMVACICGEGVKHMREVQPTMSHKNPRPPMLKFNSNSMCPIEAATIGEQVLELVQFVNESYKPSRAFAELY